MKYELLRKWYESNDVIVAAEEFLGVHALALFFQKIAKLEYRWLTCIDVKGDYVEKQEVVKSCS